MGMTQPEVPWLSDQINTRLRQLLRGAWCDVDITKAGFKTNASAVIKDLEKVDRDVKQREALAAVKRLSEGRKQQQEEEKGKNDEQIKACREKARVDLVVQLAAIKAAMLRCRAGVQEQDDEESRQQTANTKKVMGASFGTYV
jgi:hypothetical protein